MLVAAIEAVATGVLLIVSPTLFASLILGADLTVPGQALGRIAGIAMVGAGLAAWPTAGGAKGGLRALLIYNLFATIYLAYLGAAGQLGGILLWPAVALHLALSIMLGRAWLAARGAQ